MKYTNELRRKAARLRERGLSYNEIRAHVSVAKSTLSLWLKDIRLSKAHRARLYTKQIDILTRGAPSQRERRRKEVEGLVAQARAEITTPISFEARRFLGAALYWAEGGKTNGLDITNSDPALIAFMVTWLTEMFGLSPRTFKAHLNLYPQQNEREIKRFWSAVTGIPFENFGKTFIKPPNKGFKKNTLYYGTIKVRVPKGTNLRHRIFGWIQAALQDIAPTLQSHELRWTPLRETPRPPANIRP